MSKRTLILVIVHLLLAALPLSEGFLQGNMDYIPVLWLFSAVHLGQLMLLGLWLGLGNTRFRYRVLAATVGCAALSRCRWIPSIESPEVMLAVYAVVVLAVGCARLPLRRIYEMRRDPDDSHSERAAARWQFSILGLLVVTGIVAFMLTLIQRSQPTTQNPSHSEFASQVLGLIAFAINAFVAAWASLSVGRIRVRLVLALLVSVLVSATLVFNSRMWDWSGARAFALGGAFVLPSMIVVVSLLVVRSFGYRLVRKRSAARQGSRPADVSPATTATI